MPSPAMPESTDFSAHMNMDAINELKEIMEDEFVVLVETFLTDSLQRLEAVQEALMSSDSEAVRKTAHSFKGSSGNLGAHKLASLCKQVEDMGAAGQLDSVDQALEAIKEEFAIVKGILQNYQH